MSERIIFKVGGSLLSPYEEAQIKVASGGIPFDFGYARKILEECKNSGKAFVFIVGGGFLSRWLVKGVKNELEITDSMQTDLHHIGIASSIINAEMFRMMAAEVFGEKAVYPTVVKYCEYDSLENNVAELEKFRIIVGAGRKPGHSTDVDALLFASLFGTNQIASLKNIDGIYSGDPKNDPAAEKKRVMTWYEYRSIIKETEHKPGASFPIDAVAAQLAEKMKIGFTVIDGRDFEAVNEVIRTRLSAKGSVVSPE